MATTKWDDACDALAAVLRDGIGATGKGLGHSDNPTSSVAALRDSPFRGPTSIPAFHTPTDVGTHIVESKQEAGFNCVRLALQQSVADARAMFHMADGLLDLRALARCENLERMRAGTSARFVAEVDRS